MEITGISFDYPSVLWFLLFLPVLIGTYVYSLKLKRKEALLFSNFESLKHAIGESYSPSYIFQIMLSVFVFLLLVFAGAGLTLWYSGPIPEADFAILIDSSASMSADDIAPSRFEAAKSIALSLVDQLPPQSKVTVISFAGIPFVEQPMTDDLTKAKYVISHMKFKTEGGTDLSSSLITAVNSLSVGSNPNVALLISDGAGTVGLATKEGVDFAKSKHLTVHTVGIGSEAGGNILNIESDEKDTRLHEDTLIYIAESTSGTYQRFTDAQTFKISYEDLAKSANRKVSLSLTPLLISAVIMLIGIQWVLSFTRFLRIP